MRNAQRSSQRRTINHVTVQFESSVIENEVDSAAGFAAEVLNGVPEFAHVVAQDILFGSSEVVSARRLKGFDLLLGHVDEKGEIGRVTPQANYFDDESYLDCKKTNR